MKAVFDHLTLNVSNFPRSAVFYKDLFRYLQGQIIKEEKTHLGFRIGDGEIWLTETNPNYKKFGFHRKRTGVNHLAFRVGSPAKVNRFYQEFLLARNLPALYGPPKLYPQYTDEYYAVYFEDPDRLKLEVAYL